MKRKMVGCLVGMLFCLALAANGMAAEDLGIALCAPMSGGAASWGKKADDLLVTDFNIDPVENPEGTVVGRYIGQFEHRFWHTTFNL